MSDDLNAPVFSVAMYYPNGVYEYIARYVSAQEALIKARSYITRPAALIGVIRRVIVTDGGDCTVFEWQYGKGITFPVTEHTKAWNKAHGVSGNG